jgi:hypothetical protein
MKKIIVLTVASLYGAADYRGKKGLADAERALWMSSPTRPIAEDAELSR